MIFGQRSISPIVSKTRGGHSKTPNKSPIRKQSYRQQGKINQNYHKPSTKTKQTMGIIYMLEDIYGQLNFNQFDAFAKQKIDDARKGIEKLYKFLKDEPVCPKHPQNVLSLYCEKEKQLVCVICIYGKAQQHKGHTVKTLQQVQKTIEYETIRSFDRSKELISQLSVIHDEIDELAKEVSEVYMNINNNTINIINQTIKQLQAIKEQYDNKLSLAYRRTNTIIRRYNQSIQEVTKILETNLHKASGLSGLSKYMLLKEINKESALMEELISKFNDNRMLMDQWKKSQRQSEKAINKKKIGKHKQDDTYIVTQF